MGNSMKKNKSTGREFEQMPPAESGQQPRNGVVRRKKRSKKDKKDRKNKGMSCPPDIGGQSVIHNGGATPYNPPGEEAPRVKIKLYRSYADLDRFMQEKMQQARPDIKVHRRSTSSLPRVGRDKTKSLPANYDLDNSRDSGNESAVGSLMNGTMLTDSGAPSPSGESATQWPMRPVSEIATTPTTIPEVTLKDGRRSCASSNSQSIPSVPECKY